MPIDDNTTAKLLKVFEQVYAERGAYRAVAQQLPGWQQEFEAAMADKEYRQHVAETFSLVSNALTSHRLLEEALRSMNLNYSN